MSYTGSILMHWAMNGESDLAGYRVYHGLAPSETVNYQEVTTPWARMTGLTKYVTNYLRVTAFDDSNNESDFSSEVTVVPSGGLILK